jgi:hypothetical protein
MTVDTWGIKHLPVEDVKLSSFWCLLVGTGNWLLTNLPKRGVFVIDTAFRRVCSQILVSLWVNSTTRLEFSLAGMVSVESKSWNLPAANLLLFNVL